MERTPKVWMENQARAHAGKNAISKFIVKRKLPAPPTIKKRGCGLPKQMSVRKNKNPWTIYVDGDRRSGDHHKVRGLCHGHGRVRLSMEGTKQSLTNANVDGGIEYRRDGSRRNNMPSRMTMAATTSRAPTTNVIEGSTEYYSDCTQHGHSDDFYLESSSDGSNGNTNSGSNNETSNRDW